MAAPKMTREQAITELAKRGQDISEFFPNKSPKQIWAIQELAKRGENIDEFIEPLQQNLSPREQFLKKWGESDVGQAATGLATGAIQGITNLGTGAVNLGRRAAAALMGKEAPTPYHVDVGSHLLPENFPRNTSAEKAGEFLGVMTTPMGEIKAGSALVNAAKKIPEIGKMSAKFAKETPLLDKISGVLPWAANQAATGASYGALYGANGNAPISESAATGAVMFPAVGAGFNLAKGGMELFFTKLAKEANKEARRLGVHAQGTRTPEEAGKIAKIAEEEGLPIDISVATNNPTLKKIMLSYGSALPFSGVSKRAAIINEKVKQKADDILNYFTAGKAPEEIPSEVVGKIRENYSLHSGKSDQRYVNMMSQMNGRGIALEGRPNLEKTARKFMEENAPKEGHLSSLDASDTGVLKTLLKEKAEKEPSKELSKIINPETGKPFEYEKKVVKEKDLATDNIKTYQVLGSLERDAYKSGQMFKAKMYGELRKALMQDVEEAINKSGDKGLMKQWNANRKYHLENVVPYQDKMVRNILSGKTNERNVHKIFDEDRLRAIYHHLSPDEQKMAIFLKFQNKLSPREGSNIGIEPHVLTKAYNKMSPSEKVKNLKPNERQMLSRLHIMDKIAKEYQPYIKTPETGATVKNLMLSLFPAISGIGNIAQGNILKGVSQAIAPPVAGVALRKGASQKSMRAYAKQKYTRGHKSESLEKGAKKSLLYYMINPQE